MAAFNASLNRQGSPLTHVPIYANADFISDSRSSSNRGGVGTETSITGPENSFFVREDLSAELAMRARAHNLQIDAEENFNIPVAIEGFHNFFPLEPMPEFDEDAEKRLSSIVPFPTSTFRVTSEKDATNYCLRRLHDFKLSNTKCMNVIGQWKQLRHPNVANLRQVFTTKNKFRGGENSIVFIHDFCAGSETMAEFFSRRNTEDAVANLAAAAKCSTAASSTATSSAGFQRRLLPESTIWSFVIQLSSAIRAIHAAGLSCRVLSDPTKILFIDGARKAKINCVGVLDVVLFDPSSSRPNAVTYQQQEDLVSFGKLILMMACHSLHVPLEGDGEAKAYEHVTAHYSPDLKKLLGFFLSNTSRLRHINDIMPIIGARFYAHIDALETRNDVVEIEAGKEIQNGRLFRLISKLNTILERDEMNLDTNWSETDDRYILKLFRDFVFHQTTDANGTPLLDMSHIVSCLNKLDWGSPERLFLVSRDNYSMIYASYKDLKRCLDASFQQLVEASLQLPICYRSDDYSPKERRKNGSGNTRRYQQRGPEEGENVPSSGGGGGGAPNSRFDSNGVKRKPIRGRGIQGSGSGAEC